MYKILVVEDEWVTRNSLARGVNWCDIGCEVIGEACNGLEATKIIKDRKPDIVLSDIKMNGIDGIELCELIKRDAPEIKVIFITGYSEFTYAQTAVKLGVKDFILKPTTPRELLEAVQKAIIEIEEERNKKEEFLRLQKVIEKNIPVLRERFISELLSGSSIDPMELNDRAVFLQIAMDEFYVIVLEIDDYNAFLKNNEEKERQLIRFVIKQSIEQVMCGGGSGYAIEKGTNLWAAVIRYTGETDRSDMLENVQGRIWDYLNLSVSIGISLNFCSLQEISFAFTQAVEALHYKFYLGERSIIHFGDIHGKSEQAGRSIVFDNSLIINHIKVGDGGGALEQLEIQFIKVRDQAFTDYDLIRSNAAELMILVQRILLEQNVNINDLFPNLNVYMDISKCSTLNEIQRFFENIVTQTASYIQKRYMSQSRAVIDAIIAYMQQHYKDNITLNDLANVVYMNPKYICRLIKKETDQNFSDILTGIRIEKAKELMKDFRYKTYEIANLVGISDSRYFSQMFRKIVGMTPTEYRETKM